MRVNIQLKFFPRLSLTNSINLWSQGRLCCYNIGNLHRSIFRVFVFMTLPLDSIAKSKLKCKSDNEARKSYKFWQQIRKRIPRVGRILQLMH